MSKSYGRFIVPGALLLAVIVLGITLAINDGPIGFDAGVTRWILGHRTATDSAVMKDLTTLFSPAAVIVWTLLVAAVLAVRDRGWIRALQVLATVMCAGAVTEILKIGVDRARPPAIDQLGTLETTASYPSGHVTGACAVVFAIVAVTKARSAARQIAIVLAVAIAVTVAISRLYLGAHWLTDVLAALAVAAAVARTVALAMESRYLQAALGQLRRTLPSGSGSTSSLSER